MWIAEIIFWLALSVLIIVYFGYPLILAALAGLKRGKNLVYSSGNYYPGVTLVISVYNEAGIIKEKIKNSMAQQYPDERYKIVVVSDGSTDDTDNIVNEYASERVKLFSVEGRKGKTHALNFVMTDIDTDIVVFSDANSMYEPGAIKELVAPFQDEAVGGVCGELKYRDEAGSSSSGSSSEGLYWKYEKWIKRAESKLSRVIVFNGSIYAIRRKLHQPMCIEAANDFQHPVQVILQGYKNIYRLEAVAYEDEKKDDLTEFNRHVRITLRGWKGLFTYPQMLNPFRVSYYSVHFLLRKVLRWLSPLFLVIALVSNALLLHLPFYQGLFALQFLFYLLAFAGYFLSRKNIKTRLNPFYYFCFTNAALLIALIKFCRRTESAVWTPTSHLE